jgi:hypothetical protein
VALLGAATLLVACVTTRQTRRGVHALRVEVRGERAEGATVELAGARAVAPARLYLPYRVLRTKRTNYGLMALGALSAFLAPTCLIGASLLDSAVSGFARAFGGEPSNDRRILIGGAIAGALFGIVGGLLLYHASTTVERVEHAPYLLDLRLPQRGEVHRLQINARGARPQALRHLHRIVFDAERQRFQIEQVAAGIELRSGWRQPGSRTPGARVRPKRATGLDQLLRFR